MNILYFQSGVLPGECWAFKGSTGTAVIKLINKIYVTGFSLEHIPSNISPTGDVSTAPKEFALFVSKQLNPIACFLKELVE